jgi:hypothetical protein
METKRQRKRGNRERSLRKKKSQEEKRWRRES